jgi:prefoldin alpha subunit
MENNQVAQEFLYKFRYLKDQRDAFASQLELLNASLSNINNTKTTIENLKNLKENDEILIPIGGLANIKAKIKDPQKILLYISQEVAIEKSIEESLEFLDKVVEQHNEQINFLRNQIQSMDENLQSMSQEFQRTTPR